MDRELLLSIVAEWLEEATIPALIPRQEIQIDPEGLKRILAIVGPRRAGKTYFMYQLIQSLLDTGRWTKQDILFLDFEDYRLTGFLPSDMEELFAVFQQLTGQYPHFLFFDEVQRLPNWSRVLRTLHNQHRFKIIISGSNSQLLGREVATELRGRYEDVMMLPFSFEEYLHYRGISYSKATAYTPARGKIIAAFEEYLNYGGFPEVIMLATSAERHRLLQSYFQTVFYKDVLDRYNIKARYILDVLMRELLEDFSGLFSISRFEKNLKSNNLPGSKRTISNYLHYLQEAFFILLTEKFAYSPRQRLMNPKKVYLIDTGLAVLGRPFSENRGKILENLVAIELCRRGREAYYFKKRHECDFIIKTGSQPTEAIQVCWELTGRNEKREIAGLVEAMNSLNISDGKILTFAQSEEREVSGRKVVIQPVWRWLLETSSED
jgi:predicted AAA+ superfamily ATPase